MSDQARKDVIKGGEFIIRETSPDEIFIPEQISEEQRLMKESCHDFVEQEVIPRGSDLDEQVSLLKEAADLGIVGANIPEEFGGMELGPITTAYILDELGRGGGSFSTTLGAHTGIGMLPILYFGTDAQKEKYLPKLSAAEWQASYCLTEPEAGSDALSAKTTAKATDDGAAYLLNGQKIWTSNAGFADLFIVFAKIDGEKFTAFIVEGDSDGLSLGEEEPKMGIKGSSTRQVFFEDVRIPKDNILGEIGKGHRIAFTILNIGRFKLANMCMGGSKHVITLSTRYANERHQFDQPISSFGAIQWKLADMCIKTFALESALFRVAQLMGDMKESLIDEGHSFEEALQESGEEYAIECALLKVFGSETLDYCADEMVQIYGGYGYSEEYPASMIYRDARINRIYEGTNEINRLLSVNMMMRRTQKGKLDLTGPAWEVQKELKKMPSMDQPKGSLGAEQKAVQEMKKLVLMVAGAAVKYQMDEKIDLEEEQEILLEIADLLMYSYISESLLLRIRKGLDQDMLSAPEEVYMAILRTWLHDTTFEMKRLAVSALASFAEGDEKRILLKGVDRFLKYDPQAVNNLRGTIAEYLIENDGYAL